MAPQQQAGVSNETAGANPECRVSGERQALTSTWGTGAAAGPGAGATCGLWRAPRRRVGGRRVRPVRRRFGAVRTPERPAGCAFTQSPPPRPPSPHSSPRSDQLHPQPARPSLAPPAPSPLPLPSPSWARGLTSRRRPTALVRRPTTTTKAIDSDPRTTSQAPLLRPPESAVRGENLLPESDHPVVPHEMSAVCTRRHTRRVSLRTQPARRDSRPGSESTARCGARGVSFQPTASAPCRRAGPRLPRPSRARLADHLGSPTRRAGRRHLRPAEALASLSAAARSATQLPGGPHLSGGGSRFPRAAVSQEGRNREKTSTRDVEDTHGRST